MKVLLCEDNNYGRLSLEAELPTATGLMTTKIAVVELGEVLSIHLTVGKGCTLLIVNGQLTPELTGALYLYASKMLAIANGANA